MASTLLFILIMVFIVYSGLGITLYFMQPNLLYKPLREVSYTPEELGLSFEKVFFETQDGMELNGWYVPAENAEFVVLFCHGNGGNIMHRLDSINIFYELRISCFVFDYRGYGNSQGKPDEQGTYMDAAAAYRWLREEKNIPADNIIIFGRSLGGTIAAQLAVHVRSAAVVIESSFTSYADIGKKFYPYMPVHWFARFDYRTVDYVKKIDCPVMIIHSRDDEVIPFEFGMKLYEAADGQKEFVEISGSHNDGFLVSGEIYRKIWVQWVHFLSERKYRSLQKIQGR